MSSVSRLVASAEVEHTSRHSVGSFVAKQVLAKHVAICMATFRSPKSFANLALGKKLWTDRSFAAKREAFPRLLHMPKSVTSTRPVPLGRPYSAADSAMPDGTDWKSRSVFWQSAAQMLLGQRLSKSAARKADKGTL